MTTVSHDFFMQSLLYILQIVRIYQNFTHAKLYVVYTAANCA